jgi:hypothetical protein
LLLDDVIKKNNLASVFVNLVVMLHFSSFRFGNFVMEPHLLS